MEPLCGADVLFAKKNNLLPLSRREGLLKPRCVEQFLTHVKRRSDGWRTQLGVPPPGQMIVSGFSQAKTPQTPHHWISKYYSSTTLVYTYQLSLVKEVCATQKEVLLTTEQNWSAGWEKGKPGYARDDHINTGYAGALLCFRSHASRCFLDSKMRDNTRIKKLISAQQECERQGRLSMPNEAEH